MRLYVSTLCAVSWQCNVTQRSGGGAVASRASFNSSISASSDSSMDLLASHCATTFGMFITTFREISKHILIHVHSTRYSLALKASRRDWPTVKPRPDA